MILSRILLRSRIHNIRDEPASQEAAFRGHPANSQPAQEEEAAAAPIRTKFRGLQRCEADILLRKRSAAKINKKRVEDNTGYDDRAAPLGLSLRSLRDLYYYKISPPFLRGQVDIIYTDLLRFLMRPHKLFFFFFLYLIKIPNRASIQ